MMKAMLSGQAAAAVIFTEPPRLLRLDGATYRQISNNNIDRLFDGCNDVRSVECDTIEQAKDALINEWCYNILSKLLGLLLENQNNTSECIEISECLNEIYDSYDVNVIVSNILYSSILNVYYSRAISNLRKSSPCKIEDLLHKSDRDRILINLVRGCFDRLQYQPRDSSQSVNKITHDLIREGIFKNLVDVIAKNATKKLNVIELLIKNVLQESKIINDIIISDWVSNIILDLKNTKTINDYNANKDKKSSSSTQLRVSIPVSQQLTIRSPTSLSGIGVHSGNPVSITLHPAEAHHGIAFLRTGLANGRDRLVQAHHTQVSATELCTVIGSRETGAIASIERLMSAFYGLGVDNCLVEIDGPEMPILDGSAAPFVTAIDAVGTTPCGEPRRFIKVLKTVRSEEGHAYAELRPFERGFHLDVEIDFESPVIGRSRKAITLTPATYRRQIAHARTFGMMRDVESYWKAGFALGASLENTVAVGDGGVVNPEGLRYPDEFVRYKLLAAVGDLALSGLPILGAYRSYRCGHRLNIEMLTGFFADRSNYVIIESQKAGRSSVFSGFEDLIAKPNLSKQYE